VKARLKKLKAELKNNPSQLLPAAALITVILLRFYPLLFAGKTLIFGDNFSLMVPGKLFTASWLKRGVLPLWNPTILGGIPWIGDVNQSIFYPTTLLFTLLHPAQALNWSIIIHAIITYIGMYLVAKTWIKSTVKPQTKTKNWRISATSAALLWALSTQISDSINNLSTIQSLTWLPWVILFGLKIQKDLKYKFYFALAVTVQFAGGYPQHVVYSILGAVLLQVIAQHLKKKTPFTFWPWFKAWIIAAIISIGLSAFIWLPFITTLLQSTRMLQSTQQASIGSLHPLMLLKSIIPYLFDKPIAGYKWGPAWNGQPNVGIYLTWIGLGALVLGFKKQHRQDRLFLMIVIFSLVFALGKYLPGFQLVQNYIPFFKIGRYPSMILIITNFILALWTGLKLASLNLNNKKKFLSAMALITSLCIIGAIVINFRFELLWQQIDALLGHKLSSSQFHTMARDQVIARAVINNLLVASTLTVISAYFYFINKKTLFVLILTVEMIYATQALFFFAPSQIYDQRQLGFVAKNLQSHQGNQFRWLTRNSNQPYTDYGSYWEALVVRAPFSDSFVDQAELKSYQHACQLRTGLTPDWNMPLGINMVHGYTTLLPKNYAQLWQDSGDSQEARINFIDFIELDKERDQRLLRDWAVKYYLVDNWFEINESLDKYQKIAGEDRWTLYQLPALARFRYPDQTAVNFGAQNQFVSETPNKIELSINNARNYSHLIIADRYDQNWQAHINGVRKQVKNWQQMRLIPLEPGKNHIVLSYRPTYFYLGLALSGLTALALVVGGLITQAQSSK
jgi:hypothetical protein